MRDIDLVLQFAIGLIFALSATAKVTDPAGLVRSIAEYELLPRWLSFYIAWMLIGSEWLLAVSHLTGWMLKVVAPIGIFVLATFGIGVGLNLRRGRTIPCYCFGRASKEVISGATLARIFVLLSAEALLTGLLKISVHGRLAGLRVESASELGFTLFWTAFLYIVVRWTLAFNTLRYLLTSRSSQHLTSSMIS